MTLTVSYHPCEFITERGFDAPLVSINSPGSKPFVYHPAWNPEKILKLYFNDIDYWHITKDLNKYDFKLFDFEMARQIIEFINFYIRQAMIKNDIDNFHVYVNCEAGVSRSSAVAHMLQDHMGFKNLDHDGFYNRYVYDVLKLQFKHKQDSFDLVKDARIDFFRWYCQEEDFRKRFE